MKRPRGLPSDEGDASEAADAGTWRLVQALTGGVTTLGEDGVAALKVEAYRPQPRARSPRKPTHRLRSEDSPPRSSFSKGSRGAKGVPKPSPLLFSRPPY